ncbi:MAG: cob(I)yrinic acid a,c-diamide adenosyltransferase [Chloroflexi bacterium]|nr:cob(I)yrinic acid a,c-diamide adenosyltransferase [Chloroflexota bacterium]
MVKIYTRRGDEGETGLLYGGRVSKADPRCEACGSIDEAVSALGLARALAGDPKVKAVLKEVQRKLFTVGAELATDPSQYATMQRHFSVVSSPMVERLERWIDEMEAEVHLPRSFIVPGASAASSALDLARTILRRAERRVVTLKEAGLLVNPEVLRYVNRLSDLLFMLARYEDRSLPMETLSGDEG